MSITRTERQKQAIKKWMNAGGSASIVMATGVGKTNTALMTIQALLRKQPTLTTLIVVPTQILKDQWNNKIKEWKLDGCEVEIINTVIKHQYTCDLLIIDEAHRAAAETLSRVFNAVIYNMILCLTATMERLDGQEAIIKKYAPVVDEVTFDEAVFNGWISPVKEYAVLLDVDLTEYVELNKKFNTAFAMFNFDFKMAMDSLTNAGLRKRLASEYGVTPNEILGMSASWARTMNQRKKFSRSHPKKIEVTRKILDARKDKKCITFSSTISDAEAIGRGYVLHSKKSTKENREILKKFAEDPSGVLCTSKAVDEGVDVPTINCGIINSIDSSKIRVTQRIGRICRFEEGKVAEMFILIIKGTQEWNWFQNSNVNSDVMVINEEQLDDVLAGKEITTRKRELIEDENYRF